MSSDAVAVRHGAYADSVTLMQVSRQIADAEGVECALVAMATELNVRLSREMGLAVPAAATPNDLFVAVRARDAAAAEAAMSLASSLLDAPRAASRGARTQPSRTIGSAVRASRADVALISVPGAHAFTEAMDALEAGADVMLFSDNVSVDEEIALKDAAAERGLLVMGPDCGTAIIGGVALGFAHAVRPGPVGIVAASGTGAQQVMCLLDAADVGVSAVLGVGGRDLTAAVDGRSTRAALALLDRDPRTELIVLVSKPPDASVIAALDAFVSTLRKPVQLALLGPGRPDLTAATEGALGRIGRRAPAWPRWDGAPRRAKGALRGLFCGGTLCDEALLIASEALGMIRSNIPLRPEWTLGRSLAGSGHFMIDFGDDALTMGRAHPMIDPTLRTQHLARVLDDPATGAVLIDVLLGHGSPADPVREMLPLIARANVPVVVSLVGARDDAQNLAATATRLRDAGAWVFASNAMAARCAVSFVERA